MAEYGTYNGIGAKAPTRSDGEPSERKLRRENRHEARSRCRARESPKTEANGNIVVLDLPGEEPEIESYHVPIRAYQELDMGFLLRFPLCV